MAVAHLIGKELLQFCLILRERRLPERLNRLIDCGLVSSFGLCWRAVQQARRTEGKRAGSGQITTADLHRFLPRLRSDLTRTYQTAISGGSQPVRLENRTVPHGARK